MTAGAVDLLPKGKGGRKSGVPALDLRQPIPGKIFLSPSEKFCARCRESKPSGAFSRNPGSGDGLDWWCRVCRNAYTRAWRAENRERARELSRRGNRRWRSDPENRKRENKQRLERHRRKSQP
jgi:hypothetical protein